MRRQAVLAAAFALGITGAAFAQAQTDPMTPTIPESQIEAFQLATPYEFISAAAAVDEFILKAGELAKTNGADEELKAMAVKLQNDHRALQEALYAAGKLDKVEIAAASTDGEQQGILGKLQPQTGAEFDRSLLESLLFIHQRAIAYYRGYQKDDNLGEFAKANLPTIVEHYGALLALAPKFKLDDTTKTGATNG